MIQSATLELMNGKINIEILMGKSSLEVFGNGGEKVITTMLYPDNNDTGISFFSDGKSFLKRITIYNLSNINIDSTKE